MKILELILCKANDYFAKIEEYAMDLTGILITLITLIAVFNRYFTIISMPWYEEMVLILYMIMIYWGASRVAKENNHLTLTILSDMLKGKKVTIYLDLFVELVCLIISILGTYFAIKVSLITKMVTVSLRIPNSIVIFFSLAIGFFGLTLTYLYKFVISLEKINGKSGKEALKNG